MIFGYNLYKINLKFVIYNKISTKKYYNYKYAKKIKFYTSMYIKGIINVFIILSKFV